MPQIILGGILAIVMLLLYGWAIYDAVTVAQTGGKEISSDMSYLLNTIGGLISAAVVGILGATKAGDFPAQRTVEKSIADGILGRIAGFMPSLFILVWIICGLVMVYFGFSNKFEPLTAQGKSWLGTAIGAVYAYLGINSR